MRVALDRFDLRHTARHGKGEIAQLGEGGGEAERFAGARKTASQSAIGGKGGRQFIIQERGDLLP